MKSKLKNRSVFSISFCLWMILSSQFVYAQGSITLQAAIDTAIKNNMSLRNEVLQATYQKRMKGASIDIPQTSISGQYGQFNSFYKDNSIGIFQSINFPSVYAGQKSLQNEIYKSSLLHMSLKEAEVRKQVSEAYYGLLHLVDKRKILQNYDSVYALFLEKSNLRFAKGESNLLEKTNAEAQREQISNQLRLLNSDTEISLMRFQLLLNSTVLYMPSSDESILLPVASFDSSSIKNHPRIRLLQQEQKISASQTHLQKNKLLPDLHVGINSMTIQGTGADNVVYSGSSRFNYVQFGVGLPLFFTAQKSKINSGKILEQISENNYHYGLQEFSTEYMEAKKRYLVQKQIVKEYEEKGLQHANAISETASEQFSKGEINYLEWAMLMNNAATIRSAYVDARSELNKAVIFLIYFNEK